MGKEKKKTPLDMSMQTVCETQSHFFLAFIRHLGQYMRVGETDLLGLIT